MTERTKKQQNRHRSRIVVLAFLFTTLLSLQLSMSYGQKMSRYSGINDTPTQSPFNTIPNTQIPDFNVSGKNYKGERISINQEGGIIEIAGSEVYFSPWKHLFWSEKNLHAFFLANVTRTDFRVAFLFLANQTTGFEVKIFAYGSATYQKILYEGMGIVTSTSSPTRNPLTQGLSIVPQPKIANKLFATGPDLFLVGDRGYIKQGSTLLDLYVLRNTINSRLEWNELWALLVGSSGDYYFSIIYMNSADRNRVLLGHGLRLNDYHSLEQRELKASWGTEGEVCHLSVRAPREVRDICVDEFQFRRDDESPFKVTLTKGNHTLRLENGTDGGGGVRSGFTRWSDGDTSNPRVVSIEYDMGLTAEYSKEYLLTVESRQRCFTGGWYQEGQVVTLPQPASIEQDEVRYYFEGWSGDINSKNDTNFVIMDGPKVIRANWRTLYRITLSTSGLPDGTDVVYRLNELESRSVTPGGIQEWLTEDSMLNLDAYLPADQTMQQQLFMQGWKNRRGEDISPPIQVTGPQDLVAVFTSQKRSTELSCRVLTEDLLTAGLLIVEGEIKPPLQANVIIEFRTSGMPWTILADVETTGVGRYRYDWQPTISGIVQIRARYPGDASHLTSTSETRSVAISQSILKFKTFAGSFSSSALSSNLEVEGSGDLEGSIAAPFKIGVNVMDEMYSKLANVKPLGSICAIAIGSALIGLFYIFPCTTMIMLLAIIITKRNVNRITLFPLVIAWTVSMSYLILAELDPRGFPGSSSILMTIFTLGLAVATGLMAGLIPSGTITNSFAGRWRFK
ncbi:MAG: hypothetical protein QXO25_04900, partial [Candidatus Bathyarchaeia archaeon]